MFCLLSLVSATSLFFFFFFNDTATTEIYTLSLHDALPISSSTCRSGWISASCSRRCGWRSRGAAWPPPMRGERGDRSVDWRDRKSTRLNSSHGYISYAVFCLKKKKQKYNRHNT